MTGIPDYQDALSVANLQRGQLPFYAMDVVVGSLMPLHHHDFAELFYVYDGEGEELLNGTKHLLRPGTVSFLLPHHLHELRSTLNKPVRMYCCMFDIHVLYGSRYDFELVGRLLQTGSTLPSFVEFESEEAEQMRDIFEKIYAEYRNANFGKSSFIRSKLLEALLLFARAQIRPDESVDVGSSIKRTFWDILQHVHLHYADKLTLESLSHKYKISAPTISQSFKKLSGKSFLEYLHTLRINRALSLLSSTEMPVTDVAAEVGFESYRTFTRVFKKMKGVTPGEFRESCNRLQS